MIDWQSYLDGEMSASERAALDARLVSEPGLREQLEGFKAFVSEIGRQGQSIDVPSNRLHDCLDEVLMRPARSPRRWWFRPALAMATVLLMIFGAWAILKGPQDSFTRTPTKETVQSPSPDYASLWLRKKTGLKIPPLPVEGQHVQIVSAKYGEGWGSIQYRVANETLNLYVVSVKSMASGHSPVLYVNEKGTSWQSNGLSYYLAGPRKIRDLIVEQLIKETRSPETAAMLTDEGC